MVRDSWVQSGDQEAVALVLITETGGLLPHTKRKNRVEAILCWAGGDGAHIERASGIEIVLNSLLTCNKTAALTPRNSDDSRTKNSSVKSQS